MGISENLPPGVECSSMLRAIGITPDRDFDLTFKQVSTISGLSVRTIRGLIATGKLGCTRHNAKIVTVPLEEWRMYRESVRVRRNHEKTTALPPLVTIRHHQSLSDRRRHREISPSTNEGQNETTHIIGNRQNCRA